MYPSRGKKVQEHTHVAVAGKARGQALAPTSKKRGAHRLQIWRGARATVEGLPDNSSRLPGKVLYLCETAVSYLLAPYSPGTSRS